MHSCPRMRRHGPIPLQAPRAGASYGLYTAATFRADERHGTRSARHEKSEVACRGHGRRA